MRAKMRSVLVSSIVLCFFSVGRAYGALPPTLENLAGAWLFEEGQGDVVKDFSPHGNDGEFIDDGFSTVRDEGKFGGGLRFDNTGNFVVVPHDDIFNFGPEEDFSIGYWVDAETTDANIFIKRDGGSNNPWWAMTASLDEEDGTFRFEKGPVGPDFDNIGTNTVIVDDGWHHNVAVRRDGVLELWVDGVLEATTDANHDMDNPDTDLVIGGWGSESLDGRIDEVFIFQADVALEEQDIQSIMNNGLEAFFGGAAGLQAGDADRDLDFDQLDLVQVQIAAKYLTGQPATWGEGDWDGAPGGTQDNPPPGNGLFDQLDIIEALTAGVYLTGPYAAIQSGGTRGDDQTSIVYDPRTGELGVDAPAGTELTSVNIDSAGEIFTGNPAQNLGGSFDNDADNNIFKATFGSSFGSLSFGNVAQSGLSEVFVLSDLTVVGSLAGGGDLGDVDLIYVPEPGCVVLTLLGAVSLVTVGHRRRRNTRSCTT